jgi:hypothetical protein
MHKSNRRWLPRLADGKPDPPGLKGIRELKFFAWLPTGIKVASSRSFSIYKILKNQYCYWKQIQLVCVGKQAGHPASGAFKCPRDSEAPPIAESFQLPGLIFYNKER